MLLRRDDVSVVGGSVRSFLGGLGMTRMGLSWWKLVLVCLVLLLLLLHSGGPRTFVTAQLSLCESFPVNGGIPHILTTNNSLLLLFFFFLVSLRLLVSMFLFFFFFFLL